MTAPAVLGTKSAVRAAVARARAEGKRVALVPTMGYLHEGHLSLVDLARAEAELVVMSIFVNPMQFGPAEDLDRYPRDLPRDLALAGGRGVDLVFAPSAEEMYGGGAKVTVVADPSLEGRLDGARRPGHFRGVLTVVSKLFHVVQPDVAVFGEKDLQQLALIRRMVEDLDFPLRIVAGPVVREADGLAMSSRNVYLAPEERASALALSRGLRRAAELRRAGEADAAVLRAALVEALSAPGVTLDYAEVVDARTLVPLDRVVSGAACAVAAKVGRTRLIDVALLD